MSRKIAGESKAAVSVSVASQTHRSTVLFGGHGRAPPFLYHGGALSLYPAPSVPLGVKKLNLLSLGSDGKRTGCHFAYGGHGGSGYSRDARNDAHVGSMVVKYH